jgi:peptidoglycan/LPS O-acetylase OafA/YrhL
MLSSKGSHFFPGLNGLRAIAALSVLIKHTVAFLGIFGYHNIGRFNIDRFLLSGHQSVLLFFVLSGFLITYLLLKEQESTGAICLKRFYKGRILRIAPLYLLIIGISFLLYILFYGQIPSYHEPSHPLKTFLLLLTLPNLALVLDTPVNCAGHLWTLGVENQFYLIWPLLIIRYKKSVFWMMTSVIAIKALIQWMLIPLIAAHTDAHTNINLLSSFLNLFAIESMAIGGIGAWLVLTHRINILNIIFHPILQVLTYITIIWLVYQNSFGGVSQFTETLITPIVFLSLILNVSCNPRSILKYENRVFNYLGQISYGIYMFHPVVIFLLLWGLFQYQKTPFDHIWLVDLIYAASVITTIIIAGLSYKYFEAPILRLKNRKAIIREQSLTFSSIGRHL